MNVGIGYIAIEAQCHVCNHQWVGVVEVEYHEILGELSYKTPPVECPNCSSMSDNYKTIQP